jgi:ribosome-associated toxin RatA of RatAB toxin-antitoxin module
MEEILKTTLLEYEKSAFVIDLVKHNSGKLYIQILQTIQDEESNHKRAIKINPSLLSDMVAVLNTYKTFVPNIKDSGQTIQNETTNKIRPKSLTETEKSAIQSRYLKGVSISDLSIQFDCKKELIEQILNNNGIAIVYNKLPESKPFKEFKRRRR